MGGKRDSVENDFEFVASQWKVALKQEVTCKRCDTSEGHCADYSSVGPGVRSPWSGCGGWRAVKRCGRWGWGVLPASPESGGDSDWVTEAADCWIHQYLDEDTILKNMFLRYFDGRQKSIPVPLSCWHHREPSEHCKTKTAASAVTAGGNKDCGDLIPSRT